MPVMVKKLGKKYRVVEVVTGNPATNKAGTALDGGGHKSKHDAQSQASAVNANLHTKKARFE